MKMREDSPAQREREPIRPTCRSRLLHLLLEIDLSRRAEDSEYAVPSLMMTVHLYACIPGELKSSMYRRKVRLTRNNESIICKVSSNC